MGNGNWNQASTWSCGHMPMPGDTAVIQAGHTVWQTNNQTYSGAPLQVDVYGTWNFTGGGSKITLPCGSYVEIHEGGILNPDPTYNGFSETVRICNVTYWNTTMGSQNGYVIWPPPPSPLAVELVAFTADEFNGLVNVKFITASEKEVAHFNVYRSTAASDAMLIGSVNANGGSTLQHYQLADRPVQAGEYFYHLEEVEENGSTKDLGIAQVDIDGSNALRCTPNLLDRTDHLTVDLPELSRGIDVRIATMEGRWARPSWIDTGGSLMIVMDGQHFAPGMYMLQVVSGGDVFGTCRFKLN